MIQAGRINSYDLTYERTVRNVPTNQLIQYKLFTKAWISLEGLSDDNV
jgi:hypothetical protein